MALWDEPPFENIAGVEYLPGTDLPFGKKLRIGKQETTIYERAIEEGYRAGIRAHARHYEQTNEIEVLTDHRFTELIDQEIPRNLDADNTALWRSYFIVGWTCVSLFLVPLEEGNG